VLFEPCLPRQGIGPVRAGQKVECLKGEQASWDIPSVFPPGTCGIVSY